MPIDVAGIASTLIEHRRLEPMRAQARNRNEPCARMNGVMDCIETILARRG